MGQFKWTPTQMDRLERAARDGRRVMINRRGTEYIVTARRLTQQCGRDALVAHLPMTGEELVFKLDELDAFEPVGD